MVVSNRGVRVFDAPAEGIETVMFDARGFEVVFVAAYPTTDIQFMQGDFGVQTVTMHVAKR